MSAYIDRVDLDALRLWNKEAERMNWEYWITTAIALFAAWVAWGARVEARRASEAAEDYQRRIEILDHYPIISIQIYSENQTLKVSIMNSSHRNSGLNFQSCVEIKISAGDHAYHVEERQKIFSNGMINPQETLNLDLDKLNSIISDSIPFLSRYPESENNFLVRASVSCSGPHPKSEKINESSWARFFLDGEKLSLVDEEKSVD